MELTTDYTDAFAAIKQSYCKVLFVDLKTDTYSPKLVPDDEWTIMRKKKSYRFSEYWQWFVESELVHKDDKDMLAEFFKGLDGAGKSLIYRRKLDGEFHRVFMTLMPCVSDDGNILYVRNISETYAAAYDKIVEEVGTTDAMTGLHNKLAFQRDCKKHADDKVGFIFCDLNGLKFVNDTKGHKAGDELINKLADLLNLNFENYKCYHISGDEFIVACFGGSLHEFIIKALAFHKSMWIATKMPLASVGYSIGEAGELNKTLEQAEKEMYADKRIFYSKFPKYKRE